MSGNNYGLHANLSNLSLPFAQSVNAGVYADVNARYWPGGFNSSVAAIKGYADCDINTNSTCNGIYGGHFVLEDTSTQANAHLAYGSALYAEAILSSSAGTVTSVDGIGAKVRNASGVVTLARAIQVYAPTNTASVGTYVGLNIDDMASSISGITSAYAFRYNSATSPFVIMPSGSVGIGTTSPRAPLDIAIQSGAGGNLRLGKSSAAEGGQITFDDGTGVGAWEIDSNGADGAEYLRFFRDKGENNVTAMVISPAGNVGIGSTAPGVALDVAGAGGTPMRLRNTGGGSFWQVGPDTAGNFLVYNNSGVGAYIANGATTWTANSDRRLKNNIQRIPNSLEKLNQINGVTYWYNSDQPTDPRRVGVIAQDVQKVLPEAVSEKDGFLGVRYPDLIPLVINAVKELYEMVNSDKAEIEKLKSENAALKAYLCSKDPEAPICK